VERLQMFSAFVENEIDSTPRRKTASPRSFTVDREGSRYFNFLSGGLLITV